MTRPGSGRRVAKAPLSSTALVEVTGVTTVVGAEESRGEKADDVAAEEGAVLVGDQRAVGVAVGRDDGVEAVLRGPAVDERDVLGTSASVSTGTKVVGAAERNDVGAEGVEDVDEEIARDRALLVDADPRRHGARSRSRSAV